MPLAITLASLAMTYLVCLRPMRRTGANPVGAQSCCGAARDASTREEIARLRGELTTLRGGVREGTTAVVSGGHDAAPSRQ